jgi:hypothetical protein
MDGREVCQLNQKRQLLIKDSGYPVMCVQGGEWEQDLTHVLGWNNPYTVSSTLKSRH